MRSLLLLVLAAGAALAADLPPGLTISWSTHTTWTDAGELQYTWPGNPKGAPVVRLTVGLLTWVDGGWHTVEGIGDRTYTTTIPRAPSKPLMLNSLKVLTQAETVGVAQATYRVTWTVTVDGEQAGEPRIRDFAVDGGRHAVAQP